MVAFHLLEGEFLLAMWADVVLPFPHGKFYVFGKGAEVKMTLVTGEDIGYDAEGLLNVAIAHETGDFFLYGSDVKRLLMEGVVEKCPIETFHDSLELSHVEVGCCPIQYVLEICPKVVGIWVVLMLRHIADKRLSLSVTCLVGSHPFKSLFEKVLTNGSANYQVFTQAVCSAI